MNALTSTSVYNNSLMPQRISSSFLKPTWTGKHTTFTNKHPKYDAPFSTTPNKSTAQVLRNSIPHFNLGVSPLFSLITPLVDSHRQNLTTLEGGRLLRLMRSTIRKYPLSIATKHAHKIHLPLVPKLPSCSNGQRFAIKVSCSLNLDNNSSQILIKPYRS